MTTSLKLAITQIGDLLISNTITRDKDGNQINDINLVIPTYQRPYKWTAKNAIQLLDDIVDAARDNKESYRVGTLILHHDIKTSQYNIVDGQQRIITFSLLIESLIDSIKLENYPEKLRDNSISFFEQKLTNNSHNRRNIPNNSRALARRAKNIIEDKEKIELLNYVRKNCELIVVITQDISEAFQFFDSQNARGKKLYPHDLLKAYHLREMNDLDVTETEKIVKGWEDLDQKELAALFSNYLYRVKEWTKGNRASELNENNINKFKGITWQDNYPYAQFYKGAFAYADTVNHSTIPFVCGVRNLKPFQLDTPIVAGKPFFDYAKHYFEILKDIQNNDKYEGYLINDNNIIKTLDLRNYKNGVGNRITRLLFDTAILLYVDRFCPERPEKIDTEMLDQFVVLAFVWAYSLRAQYHNVGWQSAQNYIAGSSDVTNSINIYKIVTEADSPVSLLSALSGRIDPLLIKNIKAKKDNLDDKIDGIFQNYLYYFKDNKFMVGEI